MNTKSTNLNLDYRLRINMVLNYKIHINHILRNIFSVIIIIFSNITIFFLRYLFVSSKISEIFQTPELNGPSYKNNIYKPEIYL